MGEEVQGPIMHYNAHGICYMDRTEPHLKYNSYMCKISSLGEKRLNRSIGGRTRCREWGEEKKRTEKTE